MEYTAKPEDRDQISLYVREIETDHKPGPDGTLVAFDTIVFGKKGTNTYEQRYGVERLKRDNPVLWEHCRALYERWKTEQTIIRDGLDLKAWPAITKGQIKACEGLGLFSVEDLAKAPDSIREKLGMGTSDLIAKAREFVASKDKTAQANEMAQMRSELAQLRADLEEAARTNAALAAQAGKTLAKPRKQPEREAA